MKIIIIIDFLRSKVDKKLRLFREKESKFIIIHSTSSKFVIKKFLSSLVKFLYK